MPSRASTAAIGPAPAMNAAPPGVAAAEGRPAASSEIAPAMSGVDSSGAATT